MASLTEALYNLPTERLRALVARRDIDPQKLTLTPNKRTLANTLAQELIRGQGLNAAVIQCNARELRLLQILVTAEPNNKQVILWPKIEQAAGGKGLRESLETILAGLEDWGLAFRVEGGVFLPDLVKQHVPVSLPDRYTLEKCLEGYDAQSVKRIVRKLELKPNGETKAINIAAIKDALLDGEAGLKLNCPLNEEEIAALEHLVTLGGAAPALEIASSLYDSSEDFFRYDWQNRWKYGHERNAIDHLLARGILHVMWQGYGYNLYVMIPGDLLRVLTGGEESSFWTSPAIAPIPLEAAPPNAAQHVGINRDMTRFLGYITTNESARTGVGVIHKTSLKNAARTLSLPDERYASFVYALSRQAKIVAPQTERQIYAVTPKGVSWLYWDSLAQSRTLFEAWKTGTLWGEMYNEPLFKEGGFRTEEAMIRLRRMALRLIAEGEPGRWHDLNSLTDTLTFRAPLMLSTAGMMGPDLVASPAAFIRLLVAECLLWLGVVEIADDEAAEPLLASAPPAKRQTNASIIAQARSGKKAEPAQRATLPGAVAYRLTPLGSYLLGQPDAPTPEPEPREEKFIVQANGEIFVPPYLEPITLYRLLCLTETPAKNATSNTVTLTREAVRRALDSGDTAREILSFLQSHSRAGIPQNVEYLINEVGGKHGHIHIGQAQMYLQADSPMLMQELLARRELKPYFVKSLSDTIALLKSDDPDKMMRELRKAGYMPTADGVETAEQPALKPHGRYAPAEITPPDMPEKTAKSGRRAAKADTALDWDRIALEDNKPYAPEEAPRQGKKSLTLPEGATSSRDLIRFLLDQAIQKQWQSDIGYRVGSDEEFTNVRVEPRAITNEGLHATDIETGTASTYPLERIGWVKATRRPQEM